MRPFWYFNVSVWSGERKSCLLGMCQSSVLAPYCKEWGPKYPPNTSKRLRFPWMPLRYLQTPPRYLPDTTRHPTDTPRHLQGTWHANRRQETPTDTLRHTQAAPVSVWRCLAVPGGVWRCLLAIVGMSCSLERPWECLGDIWGVSGGIWVSFMHFVGAWVCLGGIWFLILCSM